MKRLKQNIKIKNNLGITLIALVITIIVLLILAGVTIAMLTGENGIIIKSEVAQEQTKTQSAKEQVKLEVVGAFSENGFSSSNAKNNLEKNLKATVQNSVGNSLKVEYDGYEFDVSSKGEVEFSISKPIIKSDMIPIKYVGTNEVETTIDDPAWYNYIDNQWANVKTSDGSYFVWIPRYEYKVTNGVTDPTKAGTIDINFIPLSKTTASTGYIIHPSFINDSQNGYNNGGWDKEVPGIWVAKYEMSMETNGIHIETIDETIGNIITNENTKAVSKPGVTSWGYINIGNSYLNAFEYDRDKESHLMKNSEWGAVAYLTHSKYGTNGKELEISESQEVYTGGGIGDLYKTNINQSSTGNISGIYDLCGVRWEYPAAWDTKANAEEIDLVGTSFASKDGVSTKYATAYINGKDEYDEKPELQDISKNGDAMKEVYVAGNYRWFRDFSEVIGMLNPFFVRGGNIDIDIYGIGYSGIFSSGASKGKPQRTYSFRTVLII